jgi:quinol monooxygenase YgiN
LTVAAVFEATMPRERAEELAELMREARPTRPEGVVSAALHVEGETVRLVAYWRDRETLDAYLATADVPRGVELMRKVGCEPEWRVVDVLELG